MQHGFQTRSLALYMVFDEGQNKWEELKENYKPITDVPIWTGFDLSELEKNKRIRKTQPCLIWIVLQSENTFAKHNFTLPPQENIVSPE